MHLRNLTAVLVALLFAVQAFGAGAFVQQKDFTGGASLVSTWNTGAFGSSVTAGNAIVCFVGGGRGSTPTWTLADTLGNTFNRVAAASIDQSVADNWIQEAFYALNSPGGANTVTVTSNLSVEFPMIVCAEYSGLLTAAALDGASVQRQATPGTGTDAVSSSTASNTATVTQIGFSINFNGAAAPTAGTGFTSRAATVASSARIEDRSRASTGSTSATYTVGSGQGSVLHFTQQIMLKETVGGGGGTGIILKRRKH
jgi:hypothetical protein